MLPIIVAGSRPAAAVLAQKRPFNCDTSVDLYRLRHVHVNITETGRSRLPFSSTVLLNPIGSHPLPHAQQPNRHRARRTASVSPPAISSLGGFRPPAPTRGVRGAVRHRPASENLHRLGRKPDVCVESVLPGTADIGRRGRRSVWCQQYTY